MKQHNNSQAEKLFIYYNGNGRLGNHLFGLCSSLALGIRNNRNLILGPNMRDILKLFPDLTVKFFSHDYVENYTSITEKKSKDFDESLLNLPETNITLSSCFLQSFRYFENISTMFCEKLPTINPIYSLKGREVIDKIKKQHHKPLEVVCIHVRRGDILNLKYTGYNVVSARAIKHAMSYMESILKNVQFIISSDDKKWCHKNLSKENVVFSKFTSVYDDFALLIQCSHIIMTVGTFGWWVSWFVAQKGGIIMYYRYPFAIGSLMDYKIGYHNHFPENWLAYDNDTVIETKYI